MSDILTKFSKEELKEFKKFLSSPYFNTNKTFLEILKYYTSKDFKTSSELKNNFSSNTIEEFRLIAEKFLTQKEFERDEKTYKMYNLRALKSKDERSRFFKNLKKFRKEFENTYKRDENYYTNRIIIETEYYDFMYNELMFTEPKILDEIKENIEFNFYFNYLHNFNEYIIHNRNSGKNYKINFKLLEFILKDIEKNEQITKKNHPNVYIIYLTVLISLSEKNPGKCEMLEREYTLYLKDNERRFDKDQLYHYNLYLLNRYWKLLTDTGNFEYRKKIFSLYDSADKGGYLISNNSMENDLFNNIISACITTGNINWSEKFIAKYDKIIRKDVTEDNIFYAKAKISFQKKDYNDVLQSLSRIKLQSPLTHTVTKFIYCKVYYEKGDLQGIINELENLRKFLKRNKNVSEHIELIITRFRHLIKGLLKFIDAKQITADERIKIAHSYLQEIDEMEGFIPEKLWFIEKYKAEL